MFYYYGRWVEAALCRNNAEAGPDLWFDEPVEARKICMRCPVKDECLFTALELIQRGETIKGIWGGLSAIQLKRAVQNPASIPKMRGQRSRSKTPPTFLIPVIPEHLLQDEYNKNCETGTVTPFDESNDDHIDIESLMTSQPFMH